jgi:hypothetical protein
MYDYCLDGNSLFSKSDEYTRMFFNSGLTSLSVSIIDFTSFMLGPRSYIIGPLNLRGKSLINLSYHIANCA